MTESRKWIIAALIVIPLVASAADKPKGKSQAGSQAKPAVLDFEGEVIEGQKKSPELFLQPDSQELSLEAVLYNRRHFNDFHLTDRFKRPRFSDPPVPSSAPRAPTKRPAQ